MTLGGCAFAWSNGNIGRRPFFLESQIEHLYTANKTISALLYLLLFRVMLIQWQWRRLRRASYFSLSFAFHFSSPPADPSGFPSYFLFSLFLFFSDFIFSHSHFSSPPMDPWGFSFYFISLFLLSFFLCSFPSTDPSGFSLSLSFSLLFPHLIFSPPFSFSNHFSFLFLSLLFSPSYPTMQQT